MGFFVLFVCLFICFEFLLLGRQPIPCSLARAKSDKHPFAQLTLGGVAEPQESVLAKGVCCVHIEANVRKETTCQSWLPCVFPSFHRNYAWLLFSARSTPVLSQWHVKHSSHCAKSAGGSLQVNTHTHSPQRSLSGPAMLSRHSTGIYQGNKLARNSSGNSRLLSSQLAEPPLTGSCLRREIGARELISTFFKKQKKPQAFLPPKILACEEKRHHH